MATNISARIAMGCVEERLLIAMYNGPLLQNKELMDLLVDVDARMIRQRTLLHVGVSLGKADWVEELLARGADPDLKDNSQVTALSSAVEMLQQFPEDSDRCQVLKLVTLAQRRDQAMMRRLGASSDKSTAHPTPVAKTEQDIVSLKASVDGLRKEMKCLSSQMKSSLEELKGQVCGRDALLRCIEEAVTSIAEDVTSMKGVLGRENVVGLLPSDRSEDRRECVDAMMRKTLIVYGNGVDRMRRVYERIYDEDDCTRCILKFLCGENQVKVLVDCERKFIGRMKQKFYDLDGCECNGNIWEIFADLNEDTVYLGAAEGSSFGGISCWLAWALSLISMKLAFCNGGRPYERGDAERERELQRALQQAEQEKMKMEEEINVKIGWALDRNTQFGKESHFVAAVPEIITADGSIHGRNELQEDFPLLFNFYSDHIVSTLLSKARR